MGFFSGITDAIGGAFDGITDAVGGAFDWIGDTVGGAVDTVSGQSGYNAPMPGAAPQYSAPQYSSPTNQFYADALKSNFQASAPVNRYNAQTVWNNFQARPETQQFQANPYTVNHNVDAAQNNYYAQQANLQEMDYRPGAQLALQQLTSGQGPASNTIAQQQSLADALRAQMEGRGPSLAAMQLQQATQQNNAQTMGMIGGQRGINIGLGLRQGLAQNAQANQSAAFGSGLIRAQEQLAAQGLLGQTLGQMGGLQLGQQDSATGLLGQAGGLQNQQNATRVANLAQQQQLNQATAAQNAQNQQTANLANQQTAFKNADNYNLAMQLNENVAANNLQAAMQAQGMNLQASMGNQQAGMQAQGINANTAAQNAQLNLAAQGMNQQTSLANLMAAQQAQQINAGTATQNAQLAFNTNALNSQNYLGTNQLNNASYLGTLGNETARLGINSGVDTANAGNSAGFWGNLLNAAGGAAAGAIFSDERMKYDVKRSKEEVLPGVKKATFKYKHDITGTPMEGVVAQDVEKKYPDLVGKTESGMRFVKHPALAAHPKNFAYGGQVGSVGGSVGDRKLMGQTPQQPMIAPPMAQPMPRSNGYIGGGSQIPMAPPRGNPVGAPPAGMQGGGMWGRMFNAQFRPAVQQMAQQAAVNAPRPVPGGMQMGGYAPAGGNSSVTYIAPQTYAYQPPQPIMAGPQSAPIGAPAMPQFQSWGADSLDRLFGQRRNYAAGGAVADIPDWRAYMQQPYQFMNENGQRGAAQSGKAGGDILSAIIGRMSQGNAASPGIAPSSGPYGVAGPGSYGINAAPTGGMFAMNSPADYLPFQSGGKVPGQAPYPGMDTLENDVVDAKLTPGEIVLPLSVTQAPDAPARAAQFVAAINQQKGGGYGPVAAMRQQQAAAPVYEFPPEEIVGAAPEVHEFAPDVIEGQVPPTYEFEPEEITGEAPPVYDFPPEEIVAAPPAPPTYEFPPEEIVGQPVQSFPPEVIVGQTPEQKMREYLRVYRDALTQHKLARR